MINEFMDNLPYEFANVFSDVIYLFIYLLTHNFLNIAYLFWVIFIIMVLVFLYLLLLPPKVDYILSNAYLRLVAWDQSLFSFGFADTSGMSAGKKRITQFFAILVKGMISAIRIGLVLWIGLGVLYLSAGILFLLMRHLWGFIPPDPNDISGLMIIVSLFLILSGIYFLLTFHRKCIAFSTITEFKGHYVPFLFLLFAVINALVLINYIYGFHSGTYLSTFSAKLFLVLFYIIYHNDKTLTKILSSRVSFFLWVILLLIGLTRTGILLGILPIYFLLFFLYLLVPEIKRFFPKPAEQGLEEADAV